MEKQDTHKTATALLPVGLEVIQVRLLPDGRMDAENAAIYCGLTAKTMANFRSQGKGPRYIKRGRIFYFKKDLDAWIAEHLQQTCPQGRLMHGETVNCVVDPHRRANASEPSGTLLPSRPQ